MAAGTYVQESINKKISQIYEQNDKLAPKQIWYELQNRVEQGERIPSLSYVQKYCREELFPNYNKMRATLKDKPWNTAALNSEPINAEVIPWLIGLQVSRKQFLSKPITIREAKWFNRLFGLKNDLALKYFNVDNDPKLKKRLISHVIATWAQIYAYIEKIDTIASVKEPDYTDIDRELARLNIGLAYRKANRILSDIKEKEKLTEKDFAKLNDSVSRVYIDFITRWEVHFLNHSLGDHDMSFMSLMRYGEIITNYSLTILEDGSPYQSLKKLKYRQKLAFFERLRHWCNDNPETKVTTDNFLSIVSTIQKSIERDGESK